MFMSEEYQEIELKEKNNVVPFSNFSQVLNEFLENSPENAENLIIDIKNEFIAFTIPRGKKPSS